MTIIKKTERIKQQTAQATFTTEKVNQKIRFVDVNARPVIKMKQRTTNEYIEMCALVENKHPTPNTDQLK